MSELKFTRCPLCPSTASTKDDLLRHIAVHHRDNTCSVVFSCFLCHKLFDSYDAVTAHITLNHGSTDKAIFDLIEDNEAKLFYQQLFLEPYLKCPLEDILQSKAAEVLHDLRDNGNTTQTAIDKVIKGSDSLFDIFLDVLQNNFCQKIRSNGGNSMSLNDICKTLERFRHNSLFEGLQTLKEYGEFLKEKKWLVAPDQVVLASKEVLRKTQKVDIVALHFGYAVAFFPLLEKILNLPEVLHCIENPKISKEGTFASPLDGYYYQQHPVVKKNPDQTLAFGTYVDDANLSDSASKKPLNGRFFYWNLLNLNPELRSTSNAINLLFCAQADIVKTY